MSFLHEQLRAGAWTPPWLRYQNRARYEWVAESVEGKRVIEVGCGSGHGTRVIATAGAEKVDAFDIAPESIEAAQRLHPHERVEYHVASGGALPAADRHYDLAVSLEAIEHVEDDVSFVSEIARVLRPDGVFLCSTPNRAITNPGTGISHPPYNHHHVREYSASEFEQRLGGSFGRVRLLGQRFYATAWATLLDALGKRAPRLAVRLHQTRKVAGIPFERIDKHRPEQLSPAAEPEVLLAICEDPRP